MSRVAIVEDEAHIASGLRFNLEAEGHHVTWFESGEAALDQLLAADDATDVVILDVMLPGIDGFEVVRRLRQSDRRVPVLLLTALHRPEEVLKGFDSGADDYLTKPFDLRILLARVGGLLRRRQWASQVPRPEPMGAADDDAPFVFDGNVADFQALELRTPRATHHLTLMEMNLLRYLIRHAGAVVPRGQILGDVWNLPADLETRAVDNFIVRLRRYIEINPAHPRYLLTVRGVGYRFQPTGAPQQ
jgi:DNA-binding response OmpR family regulator